MAGSGPCVDPKMPLFLSGGWTARCLLFCSAGYLLLHKGGGLDLHNLPVVAPMYTTRRTLNPRPRIPIAPLAEAAVRLFKDFWVDSPLPAELLISMLQKKPDSLDTQQLGLSLESFRV